MAYRIGKAPGSDVNVSRIIDEITFALNDIDRRVQSKENEKATLPGTTIIQQAEGATAPASQNETIIPIELLVGVDTSAADDTSAAIAQNRHIYTVTGLRVPSNIFSAIPAAFSRDHFGLRVEAMHYITDLDISDGIAGNERINFSFNMLMSLHTTNETEDMQIADGEGRIFFNSLFTLEASMPPFSVYFNVDLSNRRVSIGISPLFPNQTQAVYYGTATDISVTYDLPAVEV